MIKLEQGALFLHGCSRRAALVVVSEDRANDPVAGMLAYASGMLSTRRQGRHWKA